MKKVKNLIIGAGISGLAFANFCGKDYLIVEKENEVGGLCRTIKRNGFIWDYAGHFFHFNTDEMKDLFLKNISSNDVIYNDKVTKILYEGKLIDFPFQANIHELDKEEFIDCLYDLFNKIEKDKYDNFLDMLYGKFGKAIVEKFLKPYNEKLYATDLTSLDVEAMGRFFPYADKEQIIKNMKEHSINSYNSNFLYPKNGAVTFVNVLYNRLEKRRVLLNTSIIKIDINNRIATLSDGSLINYENLINTMPLNNFIYLLNIEKKLLNSLSYNKVLVFNLGFDKSSPLFKSEHWLYIPSKECNFYRCGFYNNILKQEKLSMYVEIGYNKDYYITQEEIDKQLKLTLDNLMREKIIDSSMSLLDHMSIIMDPAYVHIEARTNKLIEELKSKLSNYGIYTIGRYGAWIYNSMEDSMITAKELANKIGY